MWIEFPKFWSVKKKNSKKKKNVLRECTIHVEKSNDYVFIESSCLSILSSLK